MQPSANIEIEVDFVTGASTTREAASVARNHYNLSYASTVFAPVG
jgi:hypothetical protein